MSTDRITSAEVRERAKLLRSSAYTVAKFQSEAFNAFATFIDDLATQMEADEERAKGRVLAPVSVDETKAAHVHTWSDCPEMKPGDEYLAKSPRTPPPNMCAVCFFRERDPQPWSYLQRRADRNAAIDEEEKRRGD